MDFNEWWGKTVWYLTYRQGSELQIAKEQFEADVRMITEDLLIDELEQQAQVLWLKANRAWWAELDRVDAEDDVVDDVCRELERVQNVLIYVKNVLALESTRRINKK